MSIVVPTFRERENIPHLIERVRRLRETEKMEIELLFMDDDSKDGSVEAVAASGAEWAQIVERDSERGLSPAVIDGFKLARHPVIVCMDCDLSHPPEAIPQMIFALAGGQRFVIGSRYVKGGSTDDDWGFFRWLNSIIATLLARPLTSAKDPMSGFFA
ncbi:MAG: glycosyltransferase, partial [Pseudomonadota bacterium]